MPRLIQLVKNEKGSSTILAALVLFIMLGLGGLAVDASYLYKTKGEIRNTANAAALSGAQRLYTDVDETAFKASALNTANEIITANKEDDCTKVVNVMPDGTAKVSVALSKNVGTFFMRIFGVDTVPISLTSTAVRDVEVSEMGGLRPLGINKDVQPLDKNTKYIIKDDDKIGEKGWFGFIDMSGTGSDGNANELEDFMLNGTPYMKSIGDYVGIAHGNKQSIINELDKQGYSSLTVPIIVYEIIVNPQKNKEMKIVEFIWVKITWTKKEIYGQFIKTVDVDEDTGFTQKYKAFDTRLVK
ncbi:MAG: pilus assembly protein TadG-related protein [Clostridiaceae bacterium]